MNSQTLEHPLSIAMIVLKNNFALSIQNKLSHDIFIFYTPNFRKLPSNNPATLASQRLKELLQGCQLYILPFRSHLGQGKSAGDKTQIMLCSPNLGQGSGPHQLSNRASLCIRLVQKLLWFMGFSRQECWSGLPFPSPVDHVLSDLSTMTHPSWVALQIMANSFIELDKAVFHVIRLVSFLSFWFSVCLPSDGEG